MASRTRKETANAGDYGLHCILDRMLAEQTVRRGARHMHLNVFSQKIFMRRSEI